MDVREMMFTALLSMRTHALRSILTMLGILIGVASIIAIVAVGNGGKAAIVSTLESSRLQNTIEILPKELVVPGLPQPGQVLSISANDLNLVRQFHGVTVVNPLYFGQVEVTAGARSANLNLEGGPYFLPDLARFTILHGHMFTPLDVLGHRNVAVLSVGAASQLFGTTHVLGQTVTVGGQPLDIVGISASTEPSILNGILGGGAVYVPNTTLEDIFPNWTASEMAVGVVPGTSVSQLARRLVTALNIHAHSAQAFEDSSGFLAGIEKLVGTVTSILTLVIGSIASIALIVGGVGVMNIMLVSVTERTQEIGIRMSLGASRAAILVQFLMESMFITMTGGFLGILLGAAIAFGVHLATHLPMQVSWQVMVLSFLFSAVIGLICGIYPANKASKQNPIEALRYE
ncbi:ABC transporter permease [Alicyclobacillus sp. SP_1]|uniref:ABC transporter permease n=1 Tax=Alicyclobacillus sp. SP_1 TaxID=2942475 RepID=UPI0021578416|nr:ABC transporter permease [Alicyclobacillus sp. SP_1]